MCKRIEEGGESVFNDMSITETDKEIYKQLKLQKNMQNENIGLLKHNLFSHNFILNL